MMNERGIYISPEVIMVKNHVRKSKTNEIKLVMKVYY